MLRVGSGSLKAANQTSLQAENSLMSKINIVALTTSANVAPASARTADAFTRAWRSCAAAAAVDEFSRLWEKSELPGHDDEIARATPR